MSDHNSRTTTPVAYTNIVTNNPTNYRNLTYSEDDYTERGEYNSETGGSAGISLQTFTGQLRENHEDATLILLIGGFLFNILFLVSWALYRKSPFPVARQRARTSGIIFLVMLAIGLMIMVFTGFIYMAVIAAAIAAA